MPRTPDGKPDALVVETTNFHPQHMYEYACHEGNHALPQILAGAREEERAAAGKALKQSEADNEKGE